MSTNRGAFASLSIATGRELIRDPKTASANVLLPIFFLVLFVVLALLVDPSGDKDVMEVALPTATFFVLGSIAFFGTVAPAVDLRRRGTLRLLSTTPLQPSTFLLSLAPVRLAIAAIFVAVALVVSAVSGLLSVGRVPLSVAACAAGLAFFVSAGFVLAARLQSADAANNLLSLVLMVALVLAGGIVPLADFPDGVRGVVEWLPPAMMFDALEQTMSGRDAAHPLAVELGLLLAESAVLTLLATRLFRWDRHDADRAHGTRGR